jgi:hypothetical protein
LEVESPDLSTNARPMHKLLLLLLLEKGQGVNLKGEEKEGKSESSSFPFLQPQLFQFQNS